MATSDKLPNYMNLDDLRTSIDLLDSSLMLLLAERTRFIIKVGLIKKQFHLDLTQSDDRKRDLEHTIQSATQHNLTRGFIEALYNRIYSEALTIIQALPEESKVLNNNHTSDTPQQLLADLRDSINNVDTCICHILAERFKAVDKVGKYKKIHNIPPLASKRFQQVLNSKLEIAETLNIKKSFITDLFNLIHEEALRMEAAE